MSNPLSFANVAALTTAIQGFVEDTGAEFTGSINTVIQLGEARCYTDLNLEILDTTITAALTPSVRLQPIKPATNQATRTIHIRGVGGTGNFRKLARRTYEFCVEFAPTVATVGEPLYYAEVSPTEVYMVPTPDVAYQASIRQVVAPPSIVSGATWLATNMGDLLLYACMISTEEYLKADDSFVTRWKESYKEALSVRRFELRDVIRADYYPVKDGAKPVSQAG
jgi:hypothetical protein